MIWTYIFTAQTLSDPNLKRIHFWFQHLNICWAAIVKTNSKRWLLHVFSIKHHLRLLHYSIDLDQYLIGIGLYWHWHWFLVFHNKIVFSVNSKRFAYSTRFMQLFYKFQSFSFRIRTGFFQMCLCFFFLLQPCQFEIFPSKPITNRFESLSETV